MLLPVLLGSALLVFSASRRPSTNDRLTTDLARPEPATLGPSEDFERSGKIVGRFVDLDTGAPLSLLEVGWSPLRQGRRSFSDSSTTTSDEHGRFSLERLPPGRGALAGYHVIGKSSANTRWHSWAQFPVEVRAGSTVDLGDIPLVRPRAPPGSQGELELHLEQISKYDAAFIDSIESDTPAGRAGIEVCDVIVNIDGHDVSGRRAYLAPGLLSVPPGTALSLTLAGGRTVSLVAGPRMD